MTTITEDYVSFGTAKLLKKKGFDEKCRYVWVLDKATDPEDNDGVYKVSSPYFMEGESYVSNEDIDRVLKYSDEYYNKDAFLCPTLSVSMKWLREVHNWHIFVIPRWEDIEYMPGEWEEKMVGYQYVITNVGEVTRKNEQPTTTALNPETAYEAGIKYCLENLI